LNQSLWGQHFFSTRGVATFDIEKYLTAKEEIIMETQIFHHAKIQSSKNPLKEEAKILEIISITL
jgi:hypothetical protein